MGSESANAPSGFGLDELRRAVDSAGVQERAVSGWRVGLHVHHCCRSMIGIGRLLARSTPPPSSPFPSLMGSAILLGGRIPRGRSRTPDVAAPDPGITEPELIAMLDESGRLLAALPALDRRAWFRHVALGVLTRDRAARFVRIHNRHHLSIIADILAAASGASAGGALSDGSPGGSR